MNEPEHSLRTLWYAPNLCIEDEPMVKSLWKYRQDLDRWPVEHARDANLVSSLTFNGTHAPIIDLDFPHRVVPSSTPGHSHLFLDVEMSRFKLIVLMLTLWFCGVVEMGHAVWTIRRGASFVRIPGQPKTVEEDTKPTYGWFRKLK